MGVARGSNFEDETYEPPQIRNCGVRYLKLLPHDAMLSRYAVVVCPSVCLFITLLKRLK